MTFTYQHAERLLRDLTDRGSRRVVLIGGQAVNFWAHAYRQKAPSLRQGPFTSKDIDLLGDAPLVEACARAINTTPWFPRAGTPTPETGRIVCTIEGRPCEVDFLDRSAPSTREELERTAVPIKRPWGTIFVMHPFACMRSRVHNVVRIPERYDTEHGRQQLSASIVCLRCFVLDLLDRGRPARIALQIFGEVFRYCAHHPDASEAFARGFDPFDAVATHSALPPRFEQLGLPTWRRKLAQLRSA